MLTQANKHAKKLKTHTLTSTKEVLVRLFGTTFLVLSPDFCCSCSKPPVTARPPTLPMLGPKTDRSLNVKLDRSLENPSGRDLFFEVMPGKTFMNPDKASLNSLARSLWIMQCY